MLTERIRSVMGAVFGVDPDSIDDNATPGRIEQWDSMRHMSLILALEDEFGVRFSDEEVSELMSFKLIELALKNLLHDI